MFDSTVFGSTSLAYEFRLSCLCKTTVSKWIIRKGRAHAIFIDFYKIHVRPTSIVSNGKAVRSSHNLFTAGT